MKLRFCGMPWSYYLSMRPSSTLLSHCSASHYPTGSSTSFLLWRPHQSHFCFTLCTCPPSASLHTRAVLSFSFQPKCPTQEEFFMITLTQSHFYLLSYHILSYIIYIMLYIFTCYHLISFSFLCSTYDVLKLSHCVFNTVVLLVSCCHPSALEHQLHDSSG